MQVCHSFHWEHWPISELHHICIATVHKDQLKIVVTAVVFKMHYSELLAKEEEVARLKAIIQGLSENK